MISARTDNPDNRDNHLAGFDPVIGYRGYRGSAGDRRFSLSINRLKDMNSSEDTEGGTRGLGLALFHRNEARKIVMILTAFLDASGTHKDAPVFVLAGRVARQGKWWTLDKQWRKELKASGTTYYHTKEIRAGVGEYRGWSDSRKDRHIQRLSDIASRNTMFGFVISLKVSDFMLHYKNAEKPRKIRPDSMYSLCFRIALMAVPHYILSAGLQNPQLHIVQEQGDKGIADCSRILDLFRRYAPENVRDMVKTRTEGDKRSFPGLQAADLLAGGVYQAAKDQSLEIETTPISLDDSIVELRKTPELAPVIKIVVTPTVLSELRGMLFDQMEMRKALWLANRSNTREV